MADETAEAEKQSSPIHSLWRPVGGWLCMIAIGYELIALPIVSLVLGAIYGMAITPGAHVDKTLLAEMVALFVGYRSFEKYHEVASK